MWIIKYKKQLLRITLRFIVQIQISNLRPLCRRLHFHCWLHGLSFGLGHSPPSPRRHRLLQCGGLLQFADLLLQFFVFHDQSKVLALQKPLRASIRRRGGSVGFLQIAFQLVDSQILFFHALR